jgi:peptidoglycan hydrolase CwlO-like protein
MTQIFIQQAQSVAGNVALIVLLLLIAGLIGYLTAWYYSKSINIPIIRGLEAEKADLKTKVAELKDDIKKLEGKIDRLSENISSLQKQIEEREKEIQQYKKDLKE